MAIDLPSGYFTATNGLTLATTYGRAATPIRTGGTAIRPYVVPWVPTTDAFGIAFPAGLVGVAFAYPSIAATPVPDYETATLTGLQNVSYAVPGVLPTGYTARLERDAFAAAARPGGAIAVPASYSSVSAFYDNASGSALNIRSASGLTAVPWHPVDIIGGSQALIPDISLNHPAVSVAGLLSNQYNFPATTLNGLNTTMRRYSVGWRNLGVYFNAPAPTTGYTNPAGSCVIRLSHNADGSAGSTSGDLDTIDYTWTLAGSDFVNVPSSGFRLTATYATGAILPTLGTVSRYVMRIVSSTLTQTRISTGVAENYYLDGFNVRESWRCDIPLPYTATGPGALIAPGGLLT